MTYNDKYKAVIRPRPELIGTDIYWGWDVNLTDRSDDKVYPFAGGAVHTDVDAALNEGVVAMIKWMQALDVVKEKAEKPEINLDGELPEPVVEEPEVEEEPEKVDEPDAAVDTPEAAPETATE